MVQGWVFGVYLRSDLSIGGEHSSITSEEKLVLIEAETSWKKDLSIFLFFLRKPDPESLNFEENIEYLPLLSIGIVLTCGQSVSDEMKGGGQLSILDPVGINL